MDLLSRGRRKIFGREIAGARQSPGDCRVSLDNGRGRRVGSRGQLEMLVLRYLSRYCNVEPTRVTAEAHMVVNDAK